MLIAAVSPGSIVWGLPGRVEPSAGGPMDSAQALQVLLLAALLLGAVLMTSRS
jgi:hypothetical protein